MVEQVWPTAARMVRHGREAPVVAETQEADEETAVGRQRAGGGSEFGLSRQAAGDGQHRDDRQKATHRHGDPQRHVPPGRVGGQAGEGGAVVGRA